MATGTIEERVAALENKIAAVAAQLENRTPDSSKKRGWRWFVGIHANNPHFSEAIRQGREWRESDRPVDMADGDTQDSAAVSS